MVFQTFIPNVFATKKNNRGHLDLLLHGIFNLKKCHWFINNDLFGNDNCHIGDNKKIAAGKNTVFGDATTWEYLGEFELFALHWCAASGLFGHKNQQTPFFPALLHTEYYFCQLHLETWKTITRMPQTSRMWKTQILHYMLCAYLPKGQYGQPHYWTQPRAYCSLHLPRRLT